MNMKTSIIQGNYINLIFLIHAVQVRICIFSYSLYPVFKVFIQNINIDGIPLQKQFLEMLPRYIHLEVVLTL